MMSMPRFRRAGMILLYCIAVSSPAIAQENLSALAKRIEPSVVSVFSYDKDGRIVAQGSGFFVGDEGDVITGRNILKGAHHAEVRTADGMLYPIRKVLAEDKEVNLVRVSLDIPLNAVHVPQIRVALPKIGERVVAIAGPSKAEKRVSYGTVSAILEIPAFGRLLQLIARLSPSHNGSPMVNMKGEVIGVVTSANGQFYNILPIERAIGLRPGKGKLLLSEWEVEREDIAEGLYSAGLPYLWREDYEKALPFFKEAVKKDPRYANAYFQIGYCSAQLGHYDDALDPYRQAIRIKPDFVIAHFYLGLAYLELRDKDSALKEYEILKDLNQSYANDLFNMIE